MTDTPINQQRWFKHMSAGKQNFQQGKPQLAAQEFSQAIKLTPERVEGWINLGSALIESNRHNDALAALEKALTIKPDLMVSHLLLGDALRMDGQWQLALASYKKAVYLERNPASLNKLACAMRTEGKLDFAEGLYREALEIAPTFTLARVNLATLQIELSRFNEAEQQLNALETLDLNPVEQREVKFAQFCLSEYQRLQAPIAELANNNNPAPLESALRGQPDDMMHCDDALVAQIQRYAEASKRISMDNTVPLQEVPDEWPLIEAMFMIPLANSVSDYYQLKIQIESQTTLDRELQVSVNMEAPVRAAQTCRDDMADPVKAELHLRHWHAMSCNNLDGFFPGHFKYTQNWIPDNPAIKRVEPALTSPTLRRFISDIYGTVDPGYARAAVVLLALADLHVFADGNGRVAFTWLNRELEWAGLMPALFPDHLGYKGELGEALKIVQSNGNDIYPIIDVFRKAQQYALSFCAEFSAA